MDGVPFGWEPALLHLPGAGKLTYILLRMKHSAPHLLTPRDNPICLDQSLPPWLLHDLMQPLNAYGLAREQVKDAIGPLLGSDSVLNMNWEVMAKAIQTQERLLRSLRQFLNLRLSNEGAELQPTDLGRIGAQLRRQHDENAPHVFFQLHGFDGIYVNSQPDRLFDLLSCLAENAAIHAKSTVTLIASACPEGVKVEVVDDGSGLAPETINVLGMPFVRLASAHGAKRKGLGLGIYIAAKNAEILGLGLAVSSSPGEGCRFSIVLPLATVTTRPAASVEEAASIAGSRILIVDGDEQHCRALQRLFSSWGCRSEHIPNWNDAFALPVRQGSFDALLIRQDIWSRELTGIVQACRSGASPFPAIFIIADERHTQMPGLLADTSLYPCHFLQSPLTPSRLRSIMTDVLRQRSGVA